MMRILLSTLGICISLGLSAQCDEANRSQFAVPNSEMEDWIQTDLYEDIDTLFWSTANETVNLISTISPNTTKSTDAHSGTYAAKLETATWFNLIASATLFSGVFDGNAAVSNPTNPEAATLFGRPFTGRPEYFSFWYKYVPVEGDSAESYTYLTKWNGSERVLVAEAFTHIFDATNGYVEMTLPFTYYSEETPDSVSIVFASSAAGNTFQGQEGNTIYIDDISLYNCTTSITYPLSGKNMVRAYPNPAVGELVHFELEEHLDKGQLKIYANDGRLIHDAVFQGLKKEVSVQDWDTGIYHYHLLDSENNVTLGGGSFQVSH